MALITGTPLGTIQASEDLYLEGAPYIYYQRNSATPLWNPDTDGFYWGLSGTTAFPVYELGCIVGVSLSENLTMNDVLCDNVGVKSTIQQRNYLEFTFTLQQFFPLQTLSPIMKGGPVTNNTVQHTQKFGLGVIDQNKFWMVYCPKVYDNDVGDFIVIHIHKAQFVDAWTLNLPLGTPWQLTNVKLRGFADTRYPSTSQFATIVRSDLSVVV